VVGLHGDAEAVDALREARAAAEEAAGARGTNGEEQAMWKGATKKA
jgi:hypothetical protein